MPDALETLSVVLWSEIRVSGLQSLNQPQTALVQLFTKATPPFGSSQHSFLIFLRPAWTKASS